MKIKIQSNFNNLIMELIIYAIFIVQFLPLVNVFGKLVVNGISLLLLIAFLVVVLCINRRLSVEFGYIKYLNIIQFILLPPVLEKIYFFLGIYD